jgi:hypothetical protein
MAYSFPHTLTPGTPENVTDVMDNFTGHATDTEYAYSAYKTLQAQTGFLIGGLAAVDRVFANSNSGQLTVNGSSVSNRGAAVFYLDPADYTAASRTTKYRVRATLLVNATAPACNFTVGLYPVSAVAGAATELNLTLGTVTAGSTVTFTTPSASTLNQGNSGDFTAPTAGYYALGVLNSGSPIANSVMDFNVTLQMRQV